MAESLLRVVENRTFRQEKVVVDGHSFSKCIFFQCHLVYSGGAFHQHDCQLSPGCHWEFLDAAHRTLNMIRSLCDTIPSIRSELFPNWQSWVRDNPTVQ
jgi:hypothetical protein